MEHTSPVRWPLWQKLAFRFLALFLCLTVFPFPFEIVPYVTDAYKWIMNLYLQVLYNHLLGFEGKLVENMNGSGDKLYDYVSLLGIFLLSFAATLVWSLVDRKRASYKRLLEWTRVYIRYYLVFTMFGYGFSKVFHLQMPFPGPWRLMEPYGDSSPMGLLWTFIGQSKAYSAFSGWSEVIGGILLLWRPTVLLGALVTGAVMFNVAMLNFCYDVPVKIYSSMLTLMAVYLAAPDAKRLFHFFIAHKTTEAPPVRPLFTHPKWRMGARVVKLLLVGYLFYNSITDSMEGRKMYGDDAPKPALYGIWDVRELKRNGAVVAPVLTDTAYWRKMMVGWPGYATVRMANDSTSRFTFKIDSSAQTIAFETKADFNLRKFLHFEQRNDTLWLTGMWRKDSIQILLKRYDEQQFLLMRRGFRWVNESPYNR
ncbi:MAG: hypothetical protein WCR52_24095 [Bacteroidota bacterium]